MERSEDFLVGAPEAGGSGTWILLVKPGIERTYVFVPIEDSPVGGAQ